MNEYTFWLDETDTYKAVFTADSYDQALELLEKVQAFEIDITELPNFQKFGKNYEQTIAIDTLEGD